MARFLKFKYLIILKLNFKGGSILLKNIKFWLLQKIVNFAVKLSLIKKMLINCVGNFESKILRRKFWVSLNLNK